MARNLPEMRWWPRPMAVAAPGSTTSIIPDWEAFRKACVVLDSVEDTSAILAIFHGCGIPTPVGRGGRQAHEATQADLPFHRHHDPSVASAHALIGLQKPLLVADARGIVGLPDHIVQILQCDQGLELISHRRTGPRSWLARLRSLGLPG